MSMKRTDAAAPSPEAPSARGLSTLVAARELGAVAASASAAASPSVSGAPLALAHAYAYDAIVAASLQPARALVGHSACVNALAFSRCSRAPVLVSGSDDECVRLWSQNMCVGTLRGHTSNVFAVDFVGYDTLRVASGGNDGDVLLYDVPTARVCARHTAHVKKVLSVCAAPLWAPTLLTASADGTVRHWDTRQATPATLLAAAPDAVLPQAFGGGRLARLGAVAHSDAASLLLDIKLREKAPTTVSRAVRLGAHTLYSVDAHPLCAPLFLVASARGTVALYDVRALAAPLRVFAPSAPLAAALARVGLGECTGAAFSASGALVAASLLGGPLLVFDTVSGTLLHALRGHAHEATVKTVCFLGDSFVCHGSDDGRLCLWRLSDGALVVSLAERHASTVNVVACPRDATALSPEGAVLATAGLDDAVLLWDAVHDAHSDAQARARRQRLARAEAEARTPLDV